MAESVTCLFLGSGASKALADIPTTPSFLGPVPEKRSDWVNEPDLVIRGTPLSDWMKGVKDIELCMSYLHHVAYEKEVKDKRCLAARRAIVNLRAAIAQRLQEAQNQARNESKFQTTRKNFFEKFIKGKVKNLVILTTNYDCVIEELLSEGENNVRWSYPNLPLSSGKRHYFNRAREGNEHRVRIYKLHGSMNWLEKRWFKNGELKSARPPDVYVHNDQLPSAQKKEGEWAYLFKKEIGTERYNPILVPFVYQKGDWLESGRWKEIFKEHWESAENFFSKKKEVKIYFLGYSLPPADYVMLSWLLEILRKAEKVQVRIICKNDGEEPLERVLKSFTDLDLEVHRCGLERFLQCD